MSGYLRNLLVTLLCLVSQFAEASERLASLRSYSRADIYYSHWWMTDQGERRALADELQSARTEYGTKTSIRNPLEVSALMDYLQIDAMSEQEERRPEAPRLVIDVVHMDGRVVSFFSDGDYLWDVEGRRGRRVGCEFRAKFSFVRQYEEGCRRN